MPVFSPVKYIEESRGDNTALCCNAVMHMSLVVVFPGLCYTTLAIPVEFEEAQHITTYNMPLKNLQQPFPIDGIVSLPQIKKYEVQCLLYHL